MNGKTNGTVSFFYTILAVILACITVLYAGISLMIAPGLLSYEKIYYMLNDLNITAISMGKEYSSLSFDVGQGQTFGTYGGGLVVLNSNTVTAFSHSGKRTLYKQNGMSHPVLETSDKYIACYDRGGTEISIYDSFSLVCTENDLEGLKSITDYSIIDLSLSDSGSMAVAINCGVGEFRVYLYSSDRRLTAEYSYDKCVTDVALSHDESQISVLFIDNKASDGAITSEIYIYRTNSTEPMTKYSREDTIPLGGGFTLGGMLISAFSDGIVIFDGSGYKMYEEAFGDHSISLLSISKHGSVIALESEDGSGKVRIFDDRGNIAYSLSYPKGDVHEYTGYSLYDGYVILVGGSYVDLLDINTGSICRVECGRELSDAVIVPMKARKGYRMSFIVCDGSTGFVFDGITDTDK